MVEIVVGLVVIGALLGGIVPTAQRAFNKDMARIAGKDIELLRDAIHRGYSGRVDYLGLTSTSFVSQAPSSVVANGNVVHRYGNGGNIALAPQALSVAGIQRASFSITLFGLDSAACATAVDQLGEQFDEIYAGAQGNAGGLIKGAAGFSVSNAAARCSGASAAFWVRVVSSKPMAVEQCRQTLPRVGEIACTTVPGGRRLYRQIYSCSTGFEPGEYGTTNFTRDDCPGEDICPNLAGVQGKIPAGYTYDPDTATCVVTTVGVTPATDLCVNLTGDQSVVPPGFTIDANMICTPNSGDFCANIAAIQNVMPAWLTIDSSGNCAPSSGDYCRNINGKQSAIPAGFNIDSSLNCIPDSGDFCANIPGVQAQLPEGYTFDSSSLSCSPISADWCPNIAGTQSSLPAGFYVDTSGRCLPASNDFCSNITGSQPYVPAGFSIDLTSLTCTPGGSDWCQNLPGTQSSVPPGMSVTDTGDCVALNGDVCPNLDGVQYAVPNGFSLDASGNCAPDGGDYCVNLPGAQAQIPSNYIGTEGFSCTPKNGDYCLNLYGQQTGVPSGFLVDLEGNCVPSSGDWCPNIEGIQAGSPVAVPATPAGFSFDPLSGTCLPDGGDWCRQVAGIQIALPPGWKIDANGKCAPADPSGDWCSNITGIQISVPPGFGLDSLTGECAPTNADWCSNLVDVQSSIPVGYVLWEDGSCAPAGADWCPTIFGLQVSNVDSSKCVSTPQNVDWCVNMPLVQTNIPPGHYVTLAGDCLPSNTDWCKNIAGQQNAPPAGWYVYYDVCAPSTEAPIYSDWCANMPGVQGEMPAGYALDANLNCVPSNNNDWCPNIMGNQIGGLPPGFMLNFQGQCAPYDDDWCTNLPGTQADPSVYVVYDGQPWILQQDPKQGSYWRRDDTVVDIPTIAVVPSTHCAPVNGDWCTNVETVQSGEPGTAGSGAFANWKVDATGFCSPLIGNDMCTNLAGIQTTVPAGLVLSANGECFPSGWATGVADWCPNIPGNQLWVPLGYQYLVAGVTYYKSGSSSATYTVAQNGCYPMDTANNLIKDDWCPNIPNWDAAKKTILDPALISAANPTGAYQFYALPPGFYVESAMNDVNAGNCLPLKDDLGYTDWCKNFPGVQMKLPAGFTIDTTTGDCIPMRSDLDVCSGMANAFAGIQLAMPAGATLGPIAERTINGIYFSAVAADGVCVPINNDWCSNSPGKQESLPRLFSVESRATDSTAYNFYCKPITGGDAGDFCPLGTETSHYIGFPGIEGTQNNDIFKAVDAQGNPLWMLNIYGFCQPFYGYVDWDSTTHVLPAAETDWCRNLPGMQVEVPKSFGVKPGFKLNPDGSCTPKAVSGDYCQNLAQVTTQLPVGFSIAERSANYGDTGQPYLDGDCYPLSGDWCADTPDPQDATLMLFVDVQGGNQPPVGWTLNNDGTCKPANPSDWCSNITGNQTSFPRNWTVDSATGKCIPRQALGDYCGNIAGLQYVDGLGRLVDPASGNWWRLVADTNSSTNPDSGLAQISSSYNSVACRPIAGSDYCPQVTGTQALTTAFPSDQWDMAYWGGCQPRDGDWCANAVGAQSSVDVNYWSVDLAKTCAPINGDWCTNSGGPAGYKQPEPNTAGGLPGFMLDQSMLCVPINGDFCSNWSGYQANHPDTGTWYLKPTGDGINSVCAPVDGDWCKNIVGVQSHLPAGFYHDPNGDCMPVSGDWCSNIQGVQPITAWDTGAVSSTSMPINFTILTTPTVVNGVTVPDGGCAPAYGSTDWCQNWAGTQSFSVLDAASSPSRTINRSGHCVMLADGDYCYEAYGLQTVIPSGFYQDSTGKCLPTNGDWCVNIPEVQSGIPAPAGRPWVLSNYGECLPQAGQTWCENAAGSMPYLPYGSSAGGSNYWKVDLSGNCIPTTSSGDWCTNVPGAQTIKPAHLDLTTASAWTGSAWVYFLQCAPSAAGGYEYCLNARSTWSNSVTVPLGYTMGNTGICSPAFGDWCSPSGVQVDYWGGIQGYTFVDAAGAFKVESDGHCAPESGRWCSATWGGASYSGDYKPSGVTVATNNSCTNNCTAGYYLPMNTLACASCTPGNYAGAAATSCSSCPAGTMSGWTAASCTNCGSGTYSASAGSTSCPLCSPGTYSNGAANATCTYCAAGTAVSYSGAGACSSCGPGTYSNAGTSLGGSACNTTPGGYYSSGAANTGVTPCSAGKSCPGGAINNTTVCAAGYYCPGANAPMACIAGYYCPAGASVQTVCPLGTYCPAGASAATPCPGGTYGQFTGAPHVGYCYACAAGTYCPAGASTPLACPAGKYCPANSAAATACPAGSYCPANSSAPTTCPVGYYCPTASMAAPTACTASYCPTAGRTAVKCTAGTAFAGANAGFYQLGYKTSSVGAFTCRPTGGWPVYAAGWRLYMHDAGSATCKEFVATSPSSGAWSVASGGVCP
jgi:hypothetical protein